MSKYSAVVLTISDSTKKGLRIDTSGPLVCEILKENNFDIVEYAVSSDDKDDIRANLLHFVNDVKPNIIVTTGGTGFSIRDNTPEVTKEIIEKEVPGIPELMRIESMKITDRGCLSRSVCGIKDRTLILNLPGSEKSAKENLLAVIKPLNHGIEMLMGEGSAMCGERKV